MASSNIPSGKDSGGSVKQIALALELPFMVVAPVILGGAIGFFSIAGCTQSRCS